MLVAVQMLRNGFQGRVIVIEPRPHLGLGLAYSTPFHEHLLNVPAGKMSALPQQPSHFLDWLQVMHRSDADANSFAPRKLYGDYLHDLLQQTVRAAGARCFSHVRAEALDASAVTNGAYLALSDGQSIQAQRVVLALGNPASSIPPGLSRKGLEHCWHLSPWSGDALRVRFAGERILLLGAGLTAVDSALALGSQDAACKVHMLSRRGFLPQVHDLQAPAALTPVFLNRGNLRLLFRELRGHLKAARQANLCWRGVLDGLRTQSNDIWQELSVADRRRFLRHLKAYWESHRHRMAPEIRARLDRYRATGGLQILAGRIREVRRRGGATQVHVLLKHAGMRVLEVDRIINCTGIQETYTDSPRPLIRSLVESGLARANDLGIGFSTDRHGALLDAKMRPSRVFYTLGPPRRGDLLETTAVPEIRAQAEALALHLAAT